MTDILWLSEVWWEVLTAPGEVKIPGRVFWRAEHPLEVIAIFGSTGTSTKEGKEDVARWTISRDLIREAAQKGRAGEGDVQVELDSAARLTLRLASPSGTARLRTSYSPVEKFLKMTYAEVSVLTEADCLPLGDALLESLMETWEEHL